MIRISKVVCIQQFSYCKKEFVHGKTYRCYHKDGRFLVFNEGKSIPFDRHIPGRLRSGMEKYFKNYFIEEQYSYVKNKEELKEYLQEEKDEFRWRENGE